MTERNNNEYVPLIFTRPTFAVNNVPMPSCEPEFTPSFHGFVPDYNQHSRNFMHAANEILARADFEAQKIVSASYPTISKSQCRPSVIVSTKNGEKVESRTESNGIVPGIEVIQLKHEGPVNVPLSEDQLRFLANHKPLNLTQMPTFSTSSIEPSVDELIKQNQNMERIIKQLTVSPFVDVNGNDCGRSTSTSASNRGASSSPTGLGIFDNILASSSYKIVKPHKRVLKTGFTIPSKYTNCSNNRSTSNTSFSSNSLSSSSNPVARKVKNHFQVSNPYIEELHRSNFAKSSDDIEQTPDVYQHLPMEMCNVFSFQSEKSGERIISPYTGHVRLWRFILSLLEEKHFAVEWTDRDEGIFKIKNTRILATLWGRLKNRPKMNYDKLSRSLRQYYKKGILVKHQDGRKIQNVFQFSPEYRYLSPSKDSDHKTTTADAASTSTSKSHGIACSTQNKVSVIKSLNTISLDSSISSLNISEPMECEPIPLPVELDQSQNN